MLAIVRYVCSIISKKSIIALFFFRGRDGLVSHHVLDEAPAFLGFQYCFPCTEIVVIRRILASLLYVIQQRLPC